MLRQAANSLKNAVFDQWQREDQQHAMVKALWVVIAVLTLINCLMWVGWKTAPRQLRIYIPPDVSQGVWVSPDSIPNRTVYAFAYQIFSSINTWSDSGEQDYKKNILAYRHYLSSDFQESLLADEHYRASSDALKRHRILAGETGMGYEEQSVKALGNGVWEVDLRLHLIETVDTTVVKDVVMHYPLLVSRVNESFQLNPWGLVINHFYQQPYRIKTTI